MTLKHALMVSGMKGPACVSATPCKWLKAGSAYPLPELRPVSLPSDLAGCFLKCIMQPEFVLGIAQA